MHKRCWERVVHLVRRGVVVVSLVAWLAPVSGPSPVQAQTAQQKIAPALQTLMAANPLQRLPVIVEMNEASARFASAQNTVLAQQAVNILQANGQAIGPLPIIDAAAGWATSAGIQAMSLLSQVAWDNIAWDNLAWDQSGWDSSSWNSLSFD